MAERLAAAKEQGKISRQAAKIEQTILDVSGDLTRAIAERDRVQAADKARQGPNILLTQEEMAQGIAAARAKFEAYKEIERGKAAAKEAFEAFKAKNAMEKPKEKEKDVQKVPDRGPKLSR